MIPQKCLDVDENVFENLAGTIFEVRQGYKSKDSKRQNADIANAVTAYTKGLFPCADDLVGTNRWRRAYALPS